MGTVFKKKKKFQKSHKVINTKEDWGFDNEHRIAVWKDPSEEVAYGLLSIIGSTKSDIEEKSEEELIEMNHDFYYYVSQCIIDTDIEGLSFDTPEDAEKAFDSPEVDWIFLWNVLGKYIETIFESSYAIKKVLRRTGKIGTSGKTPNEKEEK